MNLNKKKKLAVRALNVGRNRIVFVDGRLDEIKEAITKKDIKDLVREGAIRIKEVSGRKAINKRNRKRSYGKIKKKIKLRKREYVIITRKLRRYIKTLSVKGKIKIVDYKLLRKKIRNKEFRSLGQFKDYIKELKWVASRKDEEKERQIIQKD